MPLKNRKLLEEKTLFKIKQKALGPEIIEDSLNPFSKRQARDDNLNALSQAYKNLRILKNFRLQHSPAHKTVSIFADPREKSQKVFELYSVKMSPNLYENARGDSEKI